MTPQSLVITNGRLVLPSGEPAKADLRCQNGRIVALGAEAAPQDGDAVFDAGGALVAPGLVDLGVFAIDKPAFHFGGITRAALMPDQAPPLDHPARVRFAAQSGKPDFWVHPWPPPRAGWRARNWPNSP
jgi:dihydroorotase